VETYRDAGLGLLGDPTRRTIFELLARHPCSAGELAQHLPISRPAVSQHLRVLNDGSLVAPRAEGTVVHASIIDMTLRLPVDDVLFDELRTDFLPRVSQHPGFRGFQYVLAERGRAVGILWYEQPEDLDGITQLVGTWFQDHIAPRLAGPETAVRGRVVVNMTPLRTTRT
jgi:DNA-binding transcriptional ArsR family regulator